MAFEIAKAGWLFRQSSILHRWKRNWFVLYVDGTLRFFENPDSHLAEEAHHISSKCIRILAGEQVADVTPPDGGFGRSCLLKVELRDAVIVMCAESPDDMRAWQMALEQARVAYGRPRSAPPCPPPYNAGMPPAYSPPYYHQNGQTVYYTAAPGQTVYAPPGYVPQGANTTTIILQDDPYYYRRGYGGYYGGGDFAMGALTGAAVGSMMMGPMFWGPGFMWC